MIFRTSAIKTFWLSLQFFSQIPTPQYAKISAREMAAAMAWAPIVGLILGLGLAMLLASAQALYCLGIPSGIIAAFILLFWVGFSKGLHLDGVADFGDAWMGAFGDKQRALKIMKDSRLGTGGVIALVFILLIKWQLLVVLVEGVLTKELNTYLLITLLLFIPGFARFNGWRLQFLSLYRGRTHFHKRVFGYWSAPFLRQRNNVYYRLLGYSMTLLLLIGLFFIGLSVMQSLIVSVIILVSFVATMLLFRGYSEKLIGGINGDSVGALVEFSEASGLLVIVLLVPYFS